MNHKPWLWRKRSMEKTIYAMDKNVSPSKIIEEEVKKLQPDKETVLKKSPESLNKKLATVLLDSHTAEHAQTPQQKIGGKDQEKQEVESDEDLYGGAYAETVTSTDTTSQEPLQPVSYTQEELEQEMCGTIHKISIEHEKIQKELEQKLRESRKRIDELTAENIHLTNALLAKEKSFGDLVRCKQQAEAEFTTLMARLDSTEKENAFLRYEFHMLEKELEIRKEEMDYSRQYAEASHKQYLESSQKASKLEAECQRLRILLHKKSTGPSGLVNMRSEVGMVRRETDMRRRKLNPTRDLIHRNIDNGNSNQVSEKSISLMIKRLQDLDEENKALKTILTKTNSELDSSRIMYAETASRLSQAEILLTKLSEGQKSMELVRYYPTSNELALVSKFDTASDDGAISTGSWANALISELEHLRTAGAEKHKFNKAFEVANMSIMDDFVEMEKRAIVSVDTPKRGYCSDISAIGRELVPVEQEIQFKHPTTEKPFDWLQIVLNAIMEEKRISKRSLDELFDDIKIALGCINHLTARKSDTIQTPRLPGGSDSSSVNSFSGFAESRNIQNFDSNLRNSVHRIIKLIEGIAPKSFVCNNCPDCLEENCHCDISQSPTSKEYFVHVFQWKVSDLNPLLHQLVHTCKDLLTGRADFENFVEEVAFALEWSINNCATSANASIARDKIKKHFSYLQSQSENENQIDVDDKQSFHSPSLTHPDDRGVCFNSKDSPYVLIEENRKLKDDLRSTISAKKDLESKLLSVIDESQTLTKQCQEAQDSIKCLESEIETLKESKGLIEDQIEKQKIINEDLDTQLTIAHAKLNDIFQKFSSLEVELEDKKNSCEELEATCLELQLQLESIVKKETPAYGRYDVEKIHQTGWEITTASSKLAECQETILNLGKQLKALASSSDAALVVTATTTAANNPTQKKNAIKRSSLRSQMEAEDGAKSGIQKPVQSEETESTKGAQNLPLNQPEKDSTLQNDKNNGTGSLVIVPSKKQGGFGLLKKLLLRRSKGKGKGTQILAKA